MSDDQTSEQTEAVHHGGHDVSNWRHGDAESVSTNVDTGGSAGEAASTNVEGEADEAETFPREYVTRLRDENAKYRQRAADRDTLARRLHRALVEATGRLADPTDLDYDDAHLGDEDTLTAAIDDLLTRKPHLASRRPSGDIGQGAVTSGEAVDLAGMLRRNAS